MARARSKWGEPCSTCYRKWHRWWCSIFRCDLRSGAIAAIVGLAITANLSGKSWRRFAFFVVVLGGWWLILTLVLWRWPVTPGENPPWPLWSQNLRFYVWLASIFAGLALLYPVTQWLFH